MSLRGVVVDWISQCKQVRGFLFVQGNGSCTVTGCLDNCSCLATYLMCMCVQPNLFIPIAGRWKLRPHSQFRKNTRVHDRKDNHCSESIVLLSMCVVCVMLVPMLLVAMPVAMLLLSYHSNLVFGYYTHTHKHTHTHTHTAHALDSMKRGKSVILLTLSRMMWFWTSLN